MPATDTYYPSVQVVERAFQPGAVSTGAVSAYGAFIGKGDQGPTTPYVVASWAEFTRVYGVNYGDLHNAVYDFFNNGGRRAYIVRLAGNASVKASIPVYDDTVATPLPDPLPTPLFTATAISQGTWGNNLRLVTSVRDAANKRFDVSLFLIPAGATFDPTKANAGWLVDQWTDVTLDPNDARYFYSLANFPSSTGSEYVVFAGQSYNPATPLVKPMPGVSGGYEFTLGANGSFSAPWVAATEYAAGVTALGNVSGPLVLNLPNMTTAAIVKAAIQACATRGDVFVVADIPMGQTAGQAATYCNTDLALNAANSAVPSFAAVYYPWVYLPAIGSPVPGRTALRPPGGAVVGAYMATDDSLGPFRAPAGRDYVLAGAAATEFPGLNETDLTTLNNNHINAIRSIPGSGVAIMGARTLKKSGKDKYVNVRRSIIEITENLKNLTEFSLFENNDERLWERLAAVCDRYLGGFWQRGGLSGASANDAYYVRVDASNNGPSSIDQGVVNVEVGVALTTPAEFIIISIGQYEGSTTVTTIA